MSNGQQSKIKVVAVRRFSIQMPRGFDPVCGDMKSFAQGETVGTLRDPRPSLDESVIVDTQYGEYRIQHQYLAIAEDQS